jgi:hypothetical protein
MVEGEKDKDSGAIKGENQNISKVKDAFTNLNTDLEKKHLNEEGTQILVLAELYRLRSEVLSLQSRLSQETEALKSKNAEYNEVNTDKKVLEVKLNQSKSFEVLYTVGIALGSACVAGARILPEGRANIYFTWTGFILLGISLLCKVSNFENIFKKEKNKK